MRSMFTIFSNGSIIPPSFKFTELHALTLAARSYALLYSTYSIHTCIHTVWILLSDPCAQVWERLGLPFPHVWPLCGSCWVSRHMSCWLSVLLVMFVVRMTSIRRLPAGSKAISVLKGEHYSHLCLLLVLQSGDIPSQSWSGQVSQLSHY